MTLPLYIAAHLIYGASMARVLVHRMRAEGELLGVPLIVTLAPICLGTAPLGAVLLRYAGSWFLHGAFDGDGYVAYERFHLGLMLAVGAAAVTAAVAAMSLVLAVLTRDRPRLANIPFAIAAAAILGALVFDGRDVFRVPGIGGRWIILHPAGFVSAAITGTLVAAWLYARARTARVVPRGRGASPALPPL